MRKSWISLLGFGAAVGLTGWFGSRYNPKNAKTRDWYEQLEKPAYNPPDYVFPIVWTTLYGLIAFSGWRTWRAVESPQRTRALGAWVGQLLSNGAWSKLFFGDRRPERALIDVLVLEAAIVAYIFNAKQVDRAAALSFVPYAGWVAFASVLNADIVRRNPNASRKFAARNIA